MPKLWGSGGKPLQNQQLGNNLPNQYLSLTPWQLVRMQDWALGNFTAEGSKIIPVPLEELPLGEQPRAMDFAALQPTIGGGFHPGIEFPYLIYYEKFFAEAFRVAAEEKRGRFDEALEILKRAWSGEPVTFHGRFHDSDQVALNLTPLQDPCPPIYVAVLRAEAYRGADSDQTGS